MVRGPKRFINTYRGAASRLEKEARRVDFSEVYFTRIKEAFWLPKEVTVTLGWNGRELRNRHEYSDFKVFSVDASERIGKPNVSKESSQSTAEPTVTL